MGSDPAGFARLRKESPVHFSAGSACGPFWSVTKFHDIREVDQNHEIFSADSSRGGHLLGFEIKDSRLGYGSCLFLNRRY